VLFCVLCLIVLLLPQGKNSFAVPLNDDDDDDDDNNNNNNDNNIFSQYEYKYPYKTPWSESASELYRPSDRRLSAKQCPYIYIK
jgi:hypothetical protein